MESANQRHAARALLVLLPILAGAAPVAALGQVAAPVLQAADEEAELAEFRAEVGRLRRIGQLRVSRRELDDLLDEEPSDAASRALRALCRRDQGDREGALEDARRALADAREVSGVPGARLRLRCAAVLSGLHRDSGDAAAALEVLDEVEGDLRAVGDSRAHLAHGLALREAGRRDAARTAFLAGANTPATAGWDELLAKARCERALGFLDRASRSLVAADERAEQGAGREPDVLVELGEIYFEGDGEVDHPEAAGRSPARMFKDALDVHAAHEGALLGLFRLHRFNWRRQSRPAHDILEQLLEAHPRSIEGQIAGCAADLEDGRLVAARRRLELLDDLAPRRREVRTLHATLAWIEHDRERAESILAELLGQDAADGLPEREVGRTLFELYRFAEGLPFLERSVERDTSDAEAWTQLGRGLANTGAEDSALQALRRAVELAEGRQDAWRHNTLLVLERVDKQYVAESHGDLTFVWRPEEAEVLRTYQVPFYEDARRELSERYGFTADPVRIEVFRRHRDFSVRSTGFEGFPALGVCFGPVVTAISPLSEMRANFSWARTAFHEFTHVIHLGLSHNRCPRWITEGLATWEEERENPTWGRNMRRDLVDAYHNDDLIPVRDLNRAFRGPRILFGYYQGGLLCRMLIDRHGFPPMIRLLEAFDRGLDLDAALDQVFGLTPEELDARFSEFVAAEIESLHIEPIWRPERAARLRLRLTREAPEDEAERAAWADDWCTVAWSAFQSGREIDAEQALRVLVGADLRPPRALFLQGMMLRRRGREEAARELWEDGFRAGGEEYRVRVMIGNYYGRRAINGEEELWLEAERHFLAAEKAFPGFPDETASAELGLVGVYGGLEREEDLMAARERWLAWNSGEYELRRQVARWHVAGERYGDACRLYAEANQVDPFRRRLHREWGEALRSDSRWEEALREFRVAVAVPPDLDADQPGPLTPRERARLLGMQALMLVELGRTEEAAATAREALELDDDAELALEALERVS